MEMLKEQIVYKGQKILKVSLPERSHVSFTREEPILDVNELTSRDKGKYKAVEVPKIDNANNRRKMQMIFGVGLRDVHREVYI